MKRPRRAYLAKEQKLKGTKRRRTGLAQSVAKEVERARLSKGDWKVANSSASLSGATGVSSVGIIYDLQANLTRGDAAKNQFSGMRIDPHGVSIRYQFSSPTTEVDNMVRW